MLARALPALGPVRNKPLWDAIAGRSGLQFANRHTGNVTTYSKLTSGDLEDASRLYRDYALCECLRVACHPRSSEITAVIFGL